MAQYYKIADKYYSVEYSQQYLNVNKKPLPTFTQVDVKDIIRNMGTGWEKTTPEQLLQKGYGGQSERDAYVKELNLNEINIDPSHPSIKSLADLGYAGATGEFGTVVLPAGILPGLGKGTLPASNLPAELQAAYQSTIDYQRRATQPTTLASIQQAAGASAGATANSAGAQAIIAEALSAKPYDQLSEAAKAYRSTGKLPTSGVSAQPGAVSGATGATTGATGAAGGIAGYTRDAQGNVYDAQGNYVTYESLPKGADGRPLMNLETLPLKGAGAPGAPVPPPTLGTSDWEKYYGGDIAREKAEAEAAKAAERQAYETGQAQKTALIESTEKMFNELFNSPEMQTAKSKQAEAQGALAKLDAEEIAVKQGIKGKVIPGWSLAGQLRLVTESYSTQKASYLADLAIANNAIEQSEKYATLAYNHNLSVLEMKIGLVEDTLKRATAISEQEKQEYTEILDQAQKLYDEKKADQKEATDLYLQLAKMGVGNISPTMGTAELLKISGPVVAQIAQDEIELKKKREKDGEDTKADEIDSFARRVNSGEIKLSNVPSAIRGQVSIKAKEFVGEELREEIVLGQTQGFNREQIIDSLAPAYPEFSKKEIRDQVFDLIPDKPQEEQLEKEGYFGGFFKRLFNF